MGRIVTPVTIKNGLASSLHIQCDALVNMLGHRLVQVKRMDLK